MRIIKPATIRGYWTRHRDAREPLEAWLKAATTARWQSIDDVRKTYPHADAVRVASGATVTVFNVKGGSYRLIAAIHYNSGIVFIRDFLTHGEYSKDQWKERH
ncbi:MAG: type II toxin-antitoxin system HigB family toxin [Phycisphaerales bacterium]